MRLLLPLFCSLLLLGSCVKNNPDPSWLEINEWQLLVNSASANPTGVLTENITDAWVYVDNELIGVFELPIKVPVLISGTREIKVYPAIQNNGISATKKMYPFLKPYIITAELVQNDVLTLNPTTMYFDEVKFWIEDFEDFSIEIVDGPTANASIQIVNDPLVIDNSINEGFFGRISLTSTDNFWAGSTIANFSSLVMALPKGKEVYLEIDYHNTNRITTGLLSVSTSGDLKDNPLIQLNPQDPSAVQWKKIYIDLREVVSGSSNVDYFEFTFQALLDDDDSSGEINIDNIKAVYF